MKLQSSLAILVLGTSLVAHGGIYTYNSGFAGGGNIPDGSTAGWSDPRNVSGATFSYVSDVTVSFTVSGGYNGDLYAYLSHNGVLVPLLNRVGTGSGDAFGYATSGFNNISLADYGNGSIHSVESPSSGATYTPDGGQMTSFVNANPNGNWTIFFADLSSDTGSHSQVTSWSLTLDGGITPVPEPVNVALGIFAGVASIITVSRTRAVRTRVQRCREAFIEWVNAV